MTNVSHTKGPWYVMASMPTNVLDSRGLRVARCDFDGVSDGPHIGEMRSNARLIAAAPDLLEACQRMEEWFHEKVRPMPSAMLAVEMAIDKATSLSA